MTDNVVTLVAPFLARIERQLNADIACLLHNVVAQQIWEEALNEPLLGLMAEHHACFTDKGRVGQ